MSRVTASLWEVDDLDPSGESRAKILARRVQAAWEERDGVWCATLGRWTVRVACSATSWDWSAFSSDTAPRALGCKGWPERIAAQRDAEATLAPLL